MHDRSTTRAQILSLAQGYLVRGGYHSFSFADIASTLGVKPAAVHYYFPSKVDLVIAVVRAYGERFDAWIAASASSTPAQRLIGYFEIGRRFAEDGCVCPLSLVIAQQQAVPEPVVEAVRAVQGRILDFYVQTLAEARASGALHFEGAAEDAGAAVASTLIGAQLLSRIEGSRAYVRIFRQQARTLGLPDPWPALVNEPMGAA